MLRASLMTAILILSIISANANALHLNPSQPETAFSMQAFGATTIPIGYYEYCKRYQARCARPSGGSYIELTQQRWTEIVDVNYQVNRTVKPLTDPEIFGVEELWEYPKNVGDCEDYVLQKRKVLNEMGYPLGSLLITVARDAQGGGHAVLTVVTDRGDYILDNVEQNVMLWKDAELYYLKRQSGSNPNTWVSLVQN
ncbi:transglutaminase-like cysteine peptidase [Ahrensia sp. 13_GOM-1096m]|uniref:transglutaminase-like cysteine peptidase n=1 Tax=Ahrensia sp. 13_GOM-1096m TaxID=1380380 RepID=UPI000479EE80|nr:transglutaminase-like cysteine peptidase [Ahrensia sp. 13_GOM-1096m]